MTDMIEKCAAAVRQCQTYAPVGDLGANCKQCRATALSIGTLEHAPDCCHDIVRAVLDAAGKEK